MKITLNNLEKFLLKKYKEKEISSIKINGKDFYVLPRVFSPIVFKESHWFAKKLSKLAKNKSLLEIGVGSGLISYLCAEKGAIVYGADINTSAIKNTKLNFDNAGLKIKLYKSNVYDELPKNLKADIIFWNHPFHKTNKRKRNILLKSVFDYEYKSLEKYFLEAKKHLNKNGRLLLGTGDVNNFKDIEKLAKETGYFMQILYKSKPMNDITEITNYILEFKEK